MSAPVIEPARLHPVDDDTEITVRLNRTDLADPPGVELRLRDQYLPATPRRTRIDASADTSAAPHRRAVLGVRHPVV